MPRKIFWGLWMTVWPVVALIPPLVTAQAPEQTAPAVSEEIIVTPAKRGATPATVVSSQAEPALEEPSDAPLFVAPVLESVQESAEPKLKESSKTTHRISLPTAEPAEKRLFEAEEFESSERLPSIGHEPAARTPGSTARPNVQRRTGPVLTEQEQRAQKLIQERAMIQAKERRARLAIKQGHRAPRTNGKSAGWQPHLTQPNWLAEMDTIE